MLNFLVRVLTALVVLVFVLPISAIIAIFTTALFILGIPFKMCDLIFGTIMYDDLSEFLFVCYGLALWLVSIPYHILTDK